MFHFSSISWTSFRPTSREPSSHKITSYALKDLINFSFISTSIDFYDAHKVKLSRSATVPTNYTTICDVAPPVPSLTAFVPRVKPQ